jgi:hypothetical protein
MLKNGLHRVTTHHGTLTHLIFVWLLSVVMESPTQFQQTMCQ